MKAHVKKFLRLMTVFVTYSCVTAFVISGRLYEIIHHMDMTWNMSKTFIFGVLGSACFWFGIGSIGVTEARALEVKVKRNVAEAIILSVLCFVLSVGILAFCFM